MQTLNLTKKYETYPEYKDSGVEWLGKIPKGWNYEKARHILREITELSKDGSETLLSVSEYFGVKPRAQVFSEEEFVSRAESLEGYKKCQKSDLVINTMLAWKMGLGVTEDDGIVSPAYAVYRFREKDFIPKFFHYLLRTKLYTEEFKANSTGVIDSRLRLYPDKFFNIPIIFPGSAEQTKIAAYLDEKMALIDQIIEKKKKQIELLREKRTAVINHAVTKGLDPNAELVDSELPWIGKIPKHWALCPNKNMLQKKKLLVGGNQSEFQMLSLTKQGVIVRDVESGKGKFSADMSTYQVVEPGDLVFCLFDIEETPRTVGLSNVHGMITGAYSVFHCEDQTLAKFIEYFYIAMDDGKRLSFLYSGLRKTIAPPRFLRISTPIPPQNEQERIVEYLNHKTQSMTSAIDAVERSVELLQEFKSSLISHVVTGKIKV